MHQQQPAARATSPAHPVRAFTEALNLIASGSGDDKVRWIAERDPDWFVDQVLRIDYTDRDAVAPRQGRIDRRVLDQAIASIALRDATHVPLRNAS